MRSEALVNEGPVMPSSLRRVFARFERRGNDGLTDRERRALAAQFQQREACPMSAREYRLNPPKRSSLPGL